MIKKYSLNMSAMEDFFSETRLQDYMDWIREEYPTPESALLQCEKATLRMSSIFPELIRVRGLAHVKEPFDLSPTKTPHWWLETPEGDIVDPTEHQFPTEILKYDPVDESKGNPTGKCPNCGDLSYGGETMCSDKCSKEYMDYLNKGI